MKTPAQWMEEWPFESGDCETALISALIAAIQRDAIAHEPLSCVEKNLPCTRAEWRFAEDMVGTEPERHWGCVQALREYIATLPKQPQYGRFTEATLREAGWYFWYPGHGLPGQFTWQSETDTIRRTGTYIGPVEPPKL